MFKDDLFKRQFYISKKKANELPVNQNEWLTKKIGTSYLHYNKHNEFLQVSSEKSNIYVLGSFYDARINENDFISDLEKVSDLISLFNIFKKVIGRYVVIFKTEKSSIIFTDALSLKQVYFNKEESLFLSNLSLYEHISDYELKYNKEALNFYKEEFHSKGGGKQWVGFESIYNGVFKLQPNHYLDVDSFCIQRYWPTEIIKPKKTKEVASEVASSIKKILERINQKYSMTIAITAGYDSRVMAAATSDFDKNKIKYFINKKDSMPLDDIDIKIGKKIADKLNVEYSINQISSDINLIPNSFADLYKSSDFYSTDRLLSTVYFYHQNYQESINICGVGEIGRTRFGVELFPVSAKFLAYKYGYVNSEFATNMCETWLSTSRDICNIKDINILTLFYWEMDLGNWGAMGNAESDISIEELNPFNCHYIFEMMMSISVRDSNYQENILFNEIISKLNPELLEDPINPRVTFWGKVKKALGSNSYFFSFLDYVKFRCIRMLNLCR